RPGTLPLFGQPAVHCSVMLIRSRLLPSRSLPPQSDRYAPPPASSSSLLVSVIVHVACCTRWNSPALQVAVSGAAVEVPAPQLLPLFCSSQNRLNLLRWLA